MKYAIILATLMATTAQAQSDWTGVDKVWHFSSCAAISAAVTTATGSEAKGIGTCIALGAAKELYSINQYGHTDNLQDMVYNTLGGIVGAKLGINFMVVPTNGGFRVTWRKEL
jgi:uncharacterized protein YfiM (DUF2279 family)